MKQVQGTSLNISNDIVGRITFGKINPFARGKHILVSKSYKKALGYAATICQDNSSASTRAICVVNDISTFNEGDIVIINSDGLISFVYEIKSSHNSIMATFRCNHRCIMCPQPPVSEEEDRTDLNLFLISLFDKSTQEVGISGGEPTLIGDKLFILIKQIQKHLPNAAVSILSNGVKFADKSYAKKLATCHHPNLQIDIPLFSDIADEHNAIVGAKTFYKTVKGLYNLASFRQKIGIRIVIHKKTYKRLPQLAEFIYHNFPFVSQVAFMQMETTGLAKKNIEELWIDPYEYNTELRDAVLLLANRGMNPYIYNSQLCILPQDIRCFAVQSISDWKDVYLPECEGCSLKKECGGFFESNKEHHSKRIKSQKDFRQMPKPLNASPNDISSFLQAELTQELLDQYNNPVIYDIPCGYGRHLKWLASKGYKVHGFDIDEEAISILQDWRKENSADNVTLSIEDIRTISAEPSADVILNIHLYSLDILKKVTTLLKSNGVIFIETPDNIGGNHVDLPYKDEVKQYLLENNFEIKYYKESKAKFNKVAVKAIAQKKG